MAKLSARRCETEKPATTLKDKLLGDGDGLFLRITPRGYQDVDYRLRMQVDPPKMQARAFSTPKVRPIKVSRHGCRMVACR